MAQHVTLKEAIIQTRFRMGDPHMGTFGMVRYDRFTENVDELKLIINEAQRAITVACQTPTTSLLRSNKRHIQVISGAGAYPLEDTYLDTDYLIHMKGDREEPVLPREQSEWPREKTEYIEVGGTHGYYKYYDVYGVSSFEKLVGVARQQSVNELHDAFASFDGIRAGDIVHNISDRSQSEIVEVAPGTSVLNAMNELEETPGYVVVDSLEGGRSNIFQQGDQYVIASSEEISETMHVYPKLEFDEISTLSYTGDASTFRVNEAFVLHTVDVFIGDVPESIEQDDRMIMEVLKDGRLVSSDPASFASKVGVSKGVNRFVLIEEHFGDGIRIAEDTDYTIRATVGSMELNIQKVDVYSYGTSDYLIHSHSRLPEKLERDSDICEIPPFALGMLYEECKVLADMKLRRSLTPDPALQNSVDRKKLEIQDLLWSRAPRGVSHLQDEARRPRVNEADRNFVSHWI